MNDASSKEAIASEFRKALENFNTMAADSSLPDTILEAVDTCVEALQAGGRLLFAGNGGSAADAQHWAGELVSRFYYDRPGLAAIARFSRTDRLAKMPRPSGTYATPSRATS